MDYQTIVNLIVGPASGLVILLLAIYGLLKQWVVPKAFYEASNRRGHLLEEENSELNRAVVELTRQNTNLQIEVASLKIEVRHLQQQMTTYLGRQNVELGG
jgi:hypothetical protein